MLTQTEVGRSTLVVDWEIKLLESYTIASLTAVPIFHFHPGWRQAISFRLE